MRLAIAEAASGQRRVDARRVVAALGGEEQCPAERVLAVQRNRSTDHRRAGNCLGRHEIKIHLLRIGFVDTNAVEENAHALWNADYWREQPPSDIEAGLCPCPLIVEH